MEFNVIIPKPVLKFISLLDTKDKSRILSKLQILEKNPKPNGSIKLKGYDNQSRIRVGDYRIRYYVEIEKNEIVILDIAHRKDIYKK